MKGIQPDGNNLFLNFLKTNGCSLDGGVQLFWVSFDMPVTVVPLKVALGF